MAWLLIGWLFLTGCPEALAAVQPAAEAALEHRFLNEFIESLGYLKKSLERVDADASLVVQEQIKDVFAAAIFIRDLEQANVNLQVVGNKMEKYAKAREKNVADPAALLLRAGGLLVQLNNSLIGRYRSVSAPDAAAGAPQQADRKNFTAEIRGIFGRRAKVLRSLPYCAALAGYAASSPALDQAQKRLMRRKLVDMFGPKIAQGVSGGQDHLTASAAVLYGMLAR